MTILSFLITFLTGLLLGVVYFGGLWLTIKKFYRLRRAWLWFFLSFIGRLALCFLIFYFLVSYNWLYLLPCLLGILIVRFFSVQIIQKKYDS